MTTTTATTTLNREAMRRHGLPLADVQAISLTHYTLASPGTAGFSFGMRASAVDRRQGWAWREYASGLDGTATGGHWYPLADLDHMLEDLAKRVYAVRGLPQPGYFWTCSSGESLHDRGDTKPTRKRCTRCGRSLTVQRGWWGVFEWQQDGIYPQWQARSLYRSAVRANFGVVTSTEVVRWVPAN